jgi:hypothetical protein
LVKQAVKSVVHRSGLESGRTRSNKTHALFLCHSYAEREGSMYDMSIDDVYQLFSSYPTTIPFELTKKDE